MMTIIEVDDDPVIRLMLREALALNGHSVLEAADGDACSRHLETTRPNLIITDIFMPEKDGIETIFEIHDRWPDTKIIAMSTGSCTSRSASSRSLRLANDLLPTGRRVGQITTI
jgi:CheY-like chemotaxis protein